jgi:hypothetical protein
MDAGRPEQQTVTVGGFLVNVTFPPITLEQMPGFSMERMIELSRREGTKHAINLMGLTGTIWPLDVLETTKEDVCQALTFEVNALAFHARQYFKEHKGGIYSRTIGPRRWPESSVKEELEMRAWQIVNRVRYANRLYVALPLVDCSYPARGAVVECVTTEDNVDKDGKKRRTSFCPHAFASFFLTVTSEISKLEDI